MSLPNIYIMREHWVIKGYAKPQTIDALFIELYDCGVIEIWGTTEGVGQLAENGFTEKTKYRKESDGTKINIIDIMRCIPCSAKSWEDK